MLKPFKSMLALAVCLLFTSGIFALNPSRTYKNTPDKFGMKYKEEKIKTPDGMTLNAWLFEQPKKTSNWIIMSGSGDGNMGDALEVVNSFLSAGFNVCTYDYRGYGSSSDFKIDADLYIYPQFIVDLDAVCDYLRKSRAITKFDLYGQSIGAGLSIGVGANRTETKRIIADGPWTGLEPTKKRIKEKLGKDMNMPFGYDKMHEPMYSMEKPKNFSVKLMVIISPQDPLNGPAEMRLIKNINDLYVVKESPSNDQNFTTDKNVYFERISKFLAG